MAQYRCLCLAQSTKFVALRAAAAGQHSMAAAMRASPLHRNGQPTKWWSNWRSARHTRAPGRWAWLRWCGWPEGGAWRSNPGRSFVLPDSARKRLIRGMRNVLLVQPCTLPAALLLGPAVPGCAVAVGQAAKKSRGRSRGW